MADCGRCRVSPGLMLRPSLSDGHILRSSAGREVSPGLMLRPSLSAERRPRTRERPAGVAGADAPAFVERSRRPAVGIQAPGVSPGLMLRPSLSAVPGDS